MRAVAKVSQRKCRLMPHMHSRAVAIGPRLRRMHGDFLLKFKLRRAAERLAQDFFLVFELRGVVDVLVVASATSAEVGASRLDALRCRSDHALQAGAAEASSALDNGNLDGIARDHKRNENSLAAAMLVSGQPRQAVSAINQLFDFQLQGLPVERSGQRAAGWSASS